MGHEKSQESESRLCSNLNIPRNKKMKRASDLWKNKADDRFLYFGCYDIDKAIGGIPCAGITEIHGSAGSGQ
jgi:RecA/RadA recombinase